MDLIKKHKTVVIIAGPTAVGKTAVAIEVAKHFQTEIISADSRQCFKELNIGVARPSLEELQMIKHHFIASHSITDEVTAATFEKYALDKVNELFQQHDIVVMTGGTGLYIKAFCEGLDLVPEIPAELRNEIAAKYKEEGIEWLRNKIKEKDPRFYSEGEIKNPHRLMRALEVIEATGKSILAFQKRVKIKRDFAIVKTGLELPKKELLWRISTRVDNMMKAGLTDEVKTLLPFKHLNALQTVGYAELFDFLEDKKSLTNAMEEIKIHTRQYAKRQMTWFKKDEEMKWFQPADVDAILSWVKQKI